MEALEEPPSWEELSQMTGRELTAGAIAGLAEHSLMFPFDTIKTRLQQCPDKAFTAVLRQMLREEPLAHLWRGITPALSAAVPAHAAYFSAYEAAKRLFTNRDGTSKILGSQHACHALSAAIAVSFHDATTLPFDVVKQHMQVDTQKHTKMWPTFKHILKREGGVRRLYSSLPITITMNVPYVATHWMVYEELRKSLDLKEVKEGTPEAEETIFEFRYVVSGFLAGSCAAAVSNPFDVIKTNLQLDDRSVWGTTRDCVRSLVRKWGYGVFLSGMIPRVLQLGPSAAIVMTSYEVSKKMLGG
jgi:solute carrier family 25 (mitochondrial iron transporter), member 28/37